MNQIKQWAKKYLFISPIFKSPFFSKPNNQELMKVNPQLLASYCLRMHKHSYYDSQKAASLIDKYYSNSSLYCLSLSKLLLGTSNASLVVAQHSSPSRFQALLWKMFHNEIGQQQFKELTELYLSLKGKDQIQQFDNFVLDLSFFRLYQLALFAQLGLESASEAIGQESIVFLSNYVQNSQMKDFFSLILILQRISDKLQNYPQLKLLSRWLNPTANFSQLMQSHNESKDWLIKQSLGYMIWLLNVHELGEFVMKYTKPNYLYSKYVDESLHIVCSLLETIDIKGIVSPDQLIVLNQAIHAMSNLQLNQQLWQSVKKNLEVEQALRRMKIEVSQQLNASKVALKDMQNIQWLCSLNGYDIDFQSLASRQFIKNKIQAILSNSYFKILVDERTISALVQLARKIGQKKLQDTLLSKLSKKTNQQESNCLLAMLQEHVVNKTRFDWSLGRINSIGQLKRIKTFLGNEKTLQKLAHSSCEHNEILMRLSVEFKKSNKELVNSTVDPDLSTFFKFFWR